MANETFTRPKESFRFTNPRLKLNAAADSFSPGEFRLLTNVRAFGTDSLRTRPGQTYKFNCGAVSGHARGVLDISSFSTLGTDNKPRYIALAQSGSAALILDDGTVLGNYLVGVGSNGASMIPFRPNASPQSWIYVGGILKVSAPNPTCTVQKVGIAEPQIPPEAYVAILGPVPFSTLGGFYVHGGTASVVTNGTRVSDTVGAVLGDPASGGGGPWAVQVSSAEDYQRNMCVTVAGSYLWLVGDVFAPNPLPVNISSIFYFSGTTGRCVIVPSGISGGQGGVGQSIYEQNFLSSVRRGALIQVGSEVCYVWSVTVGTDGTVAIETSTTGTHTTADTLTSLPAILLYGDGPPAPVTGNSITAPYVNFTVSTGVGTETATAASAGLPFVSTGESFQPEDYLLFGLIFDNLSNLTELKFMFDVGDGSFTQNFYYYTIRASDVQQAISNTATQLAAAQTIDQRATIDEEDVAIAGGSVTSSSSNQTVPGSEQWSQFAIPISAFTRVGGDATKSLANYTKFQVLVNASGALNVAMDWWPSLLGGAQSDVGDAGIPYQYRFVDRSSITGAVSNPSPATRYGVNPRRSEVVVSIAANAGLDPQVNFYDIYRFGGTVTSWRYIGSVPTTGAAVVFVDNYDDAAAEAGPELDLDNYEPWPSVDLPMNATAVLVNGTVAIVSAASFPIEGTAFLPGNEVLIAGLNAYTLRTRPTVIASGPYAGDYLLQFEENAGSGTNLPIQILEPSIANIQNPYQFGPDANGTLFGCGDQYRPGTLSFSKDYNPDSVPDSFNQELVPPSEPLIGGEVLDGLAFVGSTERWWALYPQPGNPSQRYNVVQQPFPRGLVAPYGHDNDGQSLYWWAKDGIWSSSAGSLTDADLSTIFPRDGVPGKPVTYNGVTINPPDYSQAGSFRLCYANGYVYATYPDTTRVSRTLVYDIARNGWSLDIYNQPVKVFYHPAQQAGTLIAGSTPALYDELVMGDVDGNVASQADYTDDLSGSASTAPIPCTVATLEYDGGDIRAGMQWGDVWLDCVPAAQGVSLQLTPTSFGTGSAATQTIATSTARTQTPVSIGGQLLQDYLGSFLTWTDDFTKQSVPTRIYSWQPSYLIKPETIADRITDWYDENSISAKWWQGFILYADTENAVKGLQIRDSDTLTTHAFTPAVQHNGESEIAYSFNTPFIAHMVRIEPTDQKPWRFFSVRWVSEETPEMAETWQTQASSFGIRGYFHIRQVSITYASTTAVTFAVGVYDGTAPNPITLPSTGGAVQKIVVPLTFNKGQLMFFKASSSAPFQMYVDKSEVLVGPWGRSDAYSNLPLIGEPAGETAKI